jgi:hypothetical protein
VSDTFTPPGPLRTSTSASRSCASALTRVVPRPPFAGVLATSGSPTFSLKFQSIYPDSLKSREKFLAVSDWTDSVARMIQSGFLSEEDRVTLTALARDGSSPCRVTRRANALVLLDDFRASAMQTWREVVAAA